MSAGRIAPPAEPRTAPSVCRSQDALPGREGLLRHNDRQRFDDNHYKKNDRAGGRKRPCRTRQLGTLKSLQVPGSYASLVAPVISSARRFESPLFQRRNCAAFMPPGRSSASTWWAAYYCHQIAACSVSNPRGADKFRLRGRNI
jgi:hypothetical protein